ncbi:unannotated protein [freshwater metagenome]|uniref:Unannotated protein n=1 Tax=freshwater metagenome TaxID=449393 RepID=A0A6J6TYA6_9ZZZZ
MLCCALKRVGTDVATGIFQSATALSSALNTSGLLTTLSGFIGVSDAEGAGVGRRSEVAPAIQMFPAPSTAPTLAIDGESGSSGTRHNSTPLISTARAKALSTAVPKRMIVLPLTAKPEISSLAFIVVINFNALTAILEGAAYVDGINSSDEIRTSERKRFTQVPASDRGQLSWRLQRRLQIHLPQGMLTPQQ